MSSSDRFQRLEANNIADDNEIVEHNAENNFSSSDRSKKVGMKVPLEKFQIQYAKADIQEMHPIRETDFDVAFP